MRNHWLRSSLLATSSVLALTVALEQSAEACNVVTNRALPFSYNTNTCVDFTMTPAGTGNVTNNGTVTATGTAPPLNSSATGITVFIGATLNGSIVNNGTITANGNGIFMDQSTVTGSITNSTGATITSVNSAGINISGNSVGGSIINNGTINSLDVGIGFGNGTLGGLADQQ